MPDDLAQVYAEIGSVTALARHYDVPRHTAQGWVGRMRSQGGGSSER
jgi:transposase-like protein